MREEAMQGLRDWFADRMDTAFFNHICGISAAGSVYTGHNTPVEAVATADTDHFVLGLGGEAAEASVVSASASNVMNLKYIDLALEKAKTITPKIRPLRVGGEDKYVMFLHPYQVTDMRTSTTTGQWLDIQKAAMNGGQVSNNPIYTGALGEYNGVIMHESTRIKTVTAGTARAVLCGAQAATIAFGQATSSGSASWSEELFDYGNQLGVSGGLIWGLAKTRFNSKDFSTILVTTSFANASSGRAAIATT
jgi:N4-gp56 family major capsid protein